jgi:putative hydrolase of the HAD superfamily
MTADAYGAVVFDLFGTLIEFDPGRVPTLVLDGTPVPSTVPCFADHLARYAPGVPPARFAAALRTATEELYRESGDRLVEIASRQRFRRALEHAGAGAAQLDEAAIVLSRAHHAAIGTATVFPPAHREVLTQAAARGPVAVVSNFDDTSSGFAILARHGILPALATVVISEGVGVRKPHPAILATALVSLGMAASDVLFVGDSYTADVGVAHAVGAHAAWIDAAGQGVPPGAIPPRHVLRRLSDLSAVL